MTFRHWVSHLLGWNLGRVVSQSYEGYTYTAFRCDECGRISGASCIEGDWEHSFKYVDANVEVSHLPNNWS